MDQARCVSSGRGGLVLLTLQPAPILSTGALRTDCPGHGYSRTLGMGLGHTVGVPLT